MQGNYNIDIRTWPSVFQLPAHDGDDRGRDGNEGTESRASAVGNGAPAPRRAWRPKDATTGNGNEKP